MQHRESRAEGIAVASVASEKARILPAVAGNITTTSGTCSYLGTGILTLTYMRVWSWQFRERGGCIRFM